MPTSGLQRQQPAATERVLLWGQVASAAIVPLALMLCQLGLAVGDPVLPPALEMALLGAVPVGGLVWVQWRRPLYPFGLWVQYQSPESLTKQQRQWLSWLLPQPQYPWLHPHGWLAVVSGLAVYVGFRQLYVTAPAVEGVALLPPYLRLLGVLWAAVWVGMATVFLQAAVAAARLLFLADAGHTSGTPPLTVAQIRRAFTCVGQEGGAMLAGLGIPKPFDDAGRAVVESSQVAEFGPAALAVSADGSPVLKEVSAGETVPESPKSSDLESLKPEVIPAAVTPLASLENTVAEPVSPAGPTMAMVSAESSEASEEASDPRALEPVVTTVAVTASEAAAGGEPVPKEALTAKTASIESPTDSAPEEVEPGVTPTAETTPLPDGSGQGASEDTGNVETAAFGTAPTPPETTSGVVIEPLLLPMFVNVVEDTPSA